MKSLLITESERNRILGMHKSATSKHYLMEQSTGTTTGSSLTYVSSPGKVGDVNYHIYKNNTNNKFYLYTNNTPNGPVTLSDDNGGQGFNTAADVVTQLKKDNPEETDMGYFD
jgi:hypothetical protein